MTRKRTPAYARMMSRRWMISALLLAVAMVPLSIWWPVAADISEIPVGAMAVWCAMTAFEWRGWMRGYRAGIRIIPHRCDHCYRPATTVIVRRHWWRVRSYFTCTDHLDRYRRPSRWPARWRRAR